MDVSLITPTGGRPEAFDLCERWMGRQTFSGSVQWVVVDDVSPATKTTMGQEVVRPEPLWDGSHTLARNLRAGLSRVAGDFVLIIEDDDWYSPRYVADMATYSVADHLVGECPSRYYNVATRCYRKPKNFSHASLCQTGFSASMIPAVLSIMDDEPWIDLRLWSKLPGVLHEGYGCVGIKGLPGRPGVGIGHRPGGKPDPDGTMLREWIGSDAEVYSKWAT